MWPPLGPMVEHSTTGEVKDEPAGGFTLAGFKEGLRKVLGSFGDGFREVFWMFWGGFRKVLGRF